MTMGALLCRSLRVRDRRRDGATERIAAGVEAVVAGQLLPALGESGAHPA
jgi:hypothetical protein